MDDEGAQCWLWQRVVESLTELALWECIMRAEHTDQTQKEVQYSTSDMCNAEKI